MDIISFNRYNSWYTEPGETETIRIAVESEAENWHKKYKKPVIMSEYGVDTLVGLHAVSTIISCIQLDCISLLRHTKFQTLICSYKKYIIKLNIPHNSFCSSLSTFCSTPL